MTDTTFENLVFLSSSARYNTERRPLLREAFDQHLREDKFHSEVVTEQYIRDSWEGLDEREPESAFRLLLLSYPDTLNLQHYQLYLMTRYSEGSEDIRGELGFSAVDLISLEALIRTLISERAENLGINATFYEYENKPEYLEFDSFEVPSNRFRDRWAACIEFSKSELIDEIMASTDEDTALGTLSLTNQIKTIESMLSFLSTRIQDSEDYSQYQFFQTPLFEIEGRKGSVIVPFPELLISTAQMRIERLFKEDQKLVSAEDDRKGDVVEEMTMKALSEFDSRNLIKSLHFNDPHPRETDGLLLFEDSYWSIEVKSHPIFRKLPEGLGVARHRYKQKVTEAVKQGRAALDYLSGEEELLYSLTGEKSFNESENGTIVVLDGFIPTLFSQNHRVDEIFGMSEIHEEVAEDERVFVTTLFDLFELAGQSDELGRLEEFLIWRTNFGFDMPVLGMDEREYWAMYFDNYVEDSEFRRTIDDAAERNITVAYISERFNTKPHIPSGGFEE